MNNKKTLIALLAALVVVIGGFYLWQNNVADTQLPTKDQAKKQEINTDTVWKIYSSKEGNIAFEYPQSFFLLDRSEDSQRIYVSTREIVFNDFAGGYYEPVEISFKDESESNSMIQALESKKVSKTTISSKNALVISGTVPENPPYYAFDVYAIFFPEQEISIIAANRFNRDNSADLETVARKIAATFVIE